MVMTAQRDTLFYAGDPMCSWCYGFGPELDKILTAFPDVPLKIVVGGLRAHGTERFGDLREFLSEHWSEVEKVSGQPFNHLILEQSDLIYNTEPSCRAIMTAEYLNPSVTYEYFKKIQRGFYYDNHNPLDLTFYTDIAQDLGMDTLLFKNTMQSQELMNATQQSFQWASQMGVRGFPSLLAKINDEWILLSNGYQKAENIISNLKKSGLR
jgi:putative protein-disulfide isomerase